MTKPTPDELREMQTAMTATRVINEWTHRHKRYRLRRRTWPDARDNRISRCMSCGGWQWDHQCPARECWANLEKTSPANAGDAPVEPARSAQDQIRSAGVPPFAA